jgi:hypothetical protein
MHRPTALSLALVVSSAIGCSTAHDTSPLDGAGTDAWDASVVDDTGTAQRDASTRDLGPFDAGTDARASTGCIQAGLAAGPCRAGACTGGLRCWDPAMLPANAMTVQGAFALAQGNAADPSHPGFQLVDVPQDASRAAPFNAWEGTFCAEECDVTSTVNTCGACTSCSRTLTQLPIVQAFGGVSVWYGGQGSFPSADQGVCRVQCSFERGTRGAECDAQHTCDPYGGVCIEACTADAECNTSYGITYTGLTVTVLSTTSPARCDTTTGRCTYVGTAGASIGSRCASTNDCAPGIGLCLDGERCAEFDGCDVGQPCGLGANGVCVAVNATMHARNLCIQGCRSASDCGSGVCVPLTSAVGGYTGYCTGVCQTDDQCIASETCTDSTTTDPMTGSTTSNPGRCVHRCGDGGAPIAVGQTGASTTTRALGDCLTSEFCEPDHPGASYGFCVAVNHLCGASNTNSLPATATDCPTGSVCDETLATPHDPPSPTNPNAGIAVENFGDGHCIATCDATSCTAPATCIATGTLGGLCRRPCTRDAIGTCPIDQHCDTTLGFCVECPTYMLPGMTAPANCQ